MPLFRGVRLEDILGVHGPLFVGIGGRSVHVQLDQVLDVLGRLDPFDPTRLVPLGILGAHVVHELVVDRRGVRRNREDERRVADHPAGEHHRVVGGLRIGHSTFVGVARRLETDGFPAAQDDLGSVVTARGHEQQMRSVAVRLDTVPLAVSRIQAYLVEELVRLFGAVLGVEVLVLVTGIVRVVRLRHRVHLLSQAKEQDLIDRVPVNRKSERKPEVLVPDPLAFPTLVRLVHVDCASASGEEGLDDSVVAAALILLEDRVLGDADAAAPVKVNVAGEDFQNRDLGVGLVRPLDPVDVWELVPFRIDDVVVRVSHSYPLLVGHLAPEHPRPHGGPIRIQDDFILRLEQLDPAGIALCFSQFVGFRVVLDMEVLEVVLGRPKRLFE